MMEISAAIWDDVGSISLGYEALIPGEGVLVILFMHLQLYNL